MNDSSISFNKFRSHRGLLNLRTLSLEKIIEWILEDLQRLFPDKSPKVIILVDEIMLADLAKPPNPCQIPSYDEKFPNLHRFLRTLTSLQDQFHGAVKCVVSSLSFNALQSADVFKSYSGKHALARLPLPALSGLSTRCFILPGLLLAALKFRVEPDYILRHMMEVLARFGLCLKPNTSIPMPKSFKLTDLECWARDVVV